MEEKAEAFEASVANGIAQARLAHLGGDDPAIWSRDEPGDLTGLLAESTTPTSRGRLSADADVPHEVAELARRQAKVACGMVLDALQKHEALDSELAQRITAACVAAAAGEDASPASEGGEGSRGDFSTVHVHRDHSVRAAPARRPRAPPPRAALRASPCACRCCVSAAQEAAKQAFAVAEVMFQEHPAPARRGSAVDFNPRQAFRFLFDLPRVACLLSARPDAELVPVGDCEERLARQFDSYFSTVRTSVAIATPASLADVVFLERALHHRVEVQVVLPTPLAAFLTHVERHFELQSRGLAEVRRARGAQEPLEGDAAREEAHVDDGGRGGDAKDGDANDGDGKDGDGNEGIATAGDDKDGGGEGGGARGGAAGAGAAQAGAAAGESAARLRNAASAIRFAVRTTLASSGSVDETGFSDAASATATPSSARVRRTFALAPQTVAMMRRVRHLVVHAARVDVSNDMSPAVTQTDEHYCSHIAYGLAWMKAKATGTKVERLYASPVVQHAVHVAPDDDSAGGRDGSPAPSGTSGVLDELLEVASDAEADEGDVAAVDFGSGTVDASSAVSPTARSASQASRSPASRRPHLSRGASARAQARSTSSRVLLPKLDAQYSSRSIDLTGELQVAADDGDGRESAQHFLSHLSSANLLVDEGKVRDSHSSIVAGDARGDAVPAAVGLWRDQGKVFTHVRVAAVCAQGLMRCRSVSHLQQHPATEVSYRKDLDEVVVDGSARQLPALALPRQPSEQVIVSILFADVVGYSKIGDLGVLRFIEHFLGRVARLIEERQDRARPKVRSTWGDALYLVFAHVEDAGVFALEMADMVKDTDWEACGLPADLNLRTSLHAAPVWAVWDPVLRCVALRCASAAARSPAACAAARGTSPAPTPHGPRVSSRSRRRAPCTARVTSRRW